MNAERQTELKPTRTVPWQRILLGVSLALNLLVVGLVGGAAFRLGGPERMHRAPPIGAMLFRELPREDRRALRTHAFAPRPEREARRLADAEAIDAALRARPFDPARIESFLREQAQRRQAREQDMHRAWLARITAMTDEERAAYADRLRHAMRDRRDDGFGGLHAPHD